MSNVKTRLDKAMEARRAQVKAEAKSLVSELVDWIETLPEAEQACYWRCSSANTGKRYDDPIFVKMCGGTLEKQPGDDELLAQIDAKFPQDLLQRIEATDKAMQELGVRLDE